MALRLSPRLRAVAEQVVVGRPAVDVGTDHAHLAVYLAASGHVPWVMAIECRSGPLAAAAATIRRHGATNVELRRGHGLRGMAPGACASIILAGMGGRRIQAIIDEAESVAMASERLILQPNTDWTHVRHWLVDRGWCISTEQLVQDRRRTYLVMAVDLQSASPRPMAPLERLLGFRITRLDPVTTRFLEREIARRRLALSRLEQGGGRTHEHRRLRAELSLLLESLESSRALQESAEHG